MGIVPTSSTTIQLAIGDALAIASMNKKKFNKSDFKKFHPSGSLGVQLKMVEDLMITGKKIPFVRENAGMNKALKILSQKKLGALIVQNKNRKTIGIITDGQIRRAGQKTDNLRNLIVKNVMTPNPITTNPDTLAARALSIMNTKKITCLCVNSKKSKNKTIGIIHIHNILEANVN